MAESKWKDLVDIMHYDKKSQKYKKLQVTRTNKDRIIIKLIEGKKGEKSSKIAFQLSEEEISFLILKLQKILFDLWDKP